MPRLTAALALLASLVPVLADEINFLKTGVVTEADVNHSFLQVLAARETDGSSLGMRLKEIHQMLAPMYTSLPKTPEGKLSHEAVRYALHRYFTHHYAWHIRGIEPNSNTWTEKGRNPGIKSQIEAWVPSYVQSTLEAKLGLNGGASIDFLVNLAAVLEDIIQKEAVTRIDAMYRLHGFSRDELLTFAQATKVAQTHFIGFLLPEDDFLNATVETFQAKEEKLISTYAGWTLAYMWLHDMVDKYLKPKAQEGIAFQSIVDLVFKMAEEYFEFNDRECVDLKSTLSKMQGRKPGRVRLSTFYSKGMYTHWDFSEKREYLRTIGSLDESDPEHPYVIIPNYVMAQPNCLEPSNLLLICCTNECEDLMIGLEKKIGNATAKPERIADLVSHMPSATVSSPQVLSEEVLDRLRQIAAYHKGEVPLHGRLFAQWMHHVYPLECPYPHEAGIVRPQTPKEWAKEALQDDVKASVEERMEHVAKDSCSVNSEGSLDCADETSDIPWSDQEELLTSPVVVTRARSATPASRPWVLPFGTTPLLCAVLLLAVAVKYLVLDGSSKGKSQSIKQQRMIVLSLSCVVAYLAGVLDQGLFFLTLVCSFVIIASDRIAFCRGPRVSLDKDKYDV